MKQVGRKKCNVSGCNRVSHAKGVCHKHYERLKKYGTPTARTMYDKNKITKTSNGYLLYIHSRMGKFIGKAKIDTEDYNIVENKKWHLSSGGYVCATVGSSTLLLHREIMKPIDHGMTVDHINGDKLDNRKKNLRICTVAQNSQNTKRSKGVYWHELAKKWQAGISANKKYYYLGIFSDINDARRAYNEAAKKLHGEFARLHRIAVTQQ